MHVYNDGEVVKGAFVRDGDGKDEFIGDCWPKNSVWIDYLNENARKFWSSLYSYEKFKGTNRNFGYWIDMNEPSVFNSDELTMPRDNIHITADG
jgi:alpha 1,3-glucosidase